MNRRSLLQLSVLGLPLFHRFAYADTLDDIGRSGVLRVAILQDYPPFGSIGPDMLPRGYDVDVANLLAKKLNLKVALVPVTGANRIPYLQTRKVDIVIGCLGRNAEREKVIDFGPAYAQIYNGVFGPKELKVDGLSALVGKTIGVSRGSTEDLQLSKVVPEGAIVKRFEDSNGTISAYAAGQVDLVATGSSMAAAIAARSGNRGVDTKVKLNDERVFLGLNKDEERFKQKVNAAVQEIRADGSLAAASLKWLGTALPAEL